ncbi:PpiC-type peptidyl-prolyl cis-trans isomerase [Emticicia oligotrophica DSM 17448]|uniref:Periplasmic chaperone PpiD n=1 Tax=Emticicia oligotrophica (strain DSM 17448 / CIP 109782 / MTCC 6937 / GPTSA100-15) TaxID=929562 RepID=A0ABM5N1V0_EMTOG|nr:MULTISPECIES: peptidylprolyl isomerase [Emticicia]AFK03335.1 PpiC-type peptidyl-prolyl cis-trans isomerase [Emticicia oligotrophica DSM 17448]
MALINKIRERSGVAVVVIAVALILFIVGGDLFGGNGKSGLFSSNDNKIGEIAGTSIDYQAFQAKLDVARANYEQQAGRTLQEQEIQQLRSQVWEQMIFDITYKAEFEKLGLKVTPDELREMVQGTKNLSPLIKQQFTDPQTGQYDRNRHIEFINAAASNQLPAQQKAAWDQIKEQAIQQRLLEKYNALLSSASFVTTAEAKKEYDAQVTKADARYLYVPYASIIDTTIKVTDSQLSDYLSKHKEEFKGYDSRSFDYVVYQVMPTKEDSSALYEDIKSFAKGLATAKDAKAYAASNSDSRVPYERSSNELTPVLKEALSTAIQGAVIGPFKDGSTYSIYKYEGTTTDSLYTARASHILIRADKTAPDSVKAAARTKAQDILSQLQQGADFATLARANSQDGSAQQGGDLGTFKNNGTMVKPFENAVFGMSGAGLVPNIVETDFGYHIIKVTEAKNNLKYKIATISRELTASESTRNAIYQKAETLRASCSSVEEFEAAIKKDGKLVVLKADKVFPEASTFNTIQNAREVVLWAFNDDTKVGKVSDRVFEVGDNFIIAAVTSKTEKDSPKVEDFKDALTAKVRNEIKSQQIISKLGNVSGSLEQAAQKYGAGALVEAANDINLASGMLTSPGIDPVAIGKIFSLQAGKRSKPFAGENGVFVVETTKITKAPEIADYTQYKNQVLQRTGGYGVSYMANQAIRDNANIKDNRAKFF